MSVLEAQACGLPCLIANSSRSATPQFALSADYLFESGNVGDLVRKLDALVDDPARLMADREASQRAAAGYRIEASLEKLLGVYRQVRAAAASLYRGQLTHIPRRHVGIPCEVPVKRILGLAATFVLAVAPLASAQVSRAPRAAAAAHSRRAVYELHARQRADADRARGPQGADRRGQRLVPRRLEEREAGQDRLRAPLRAPDVQRQRELQRRLLQGARAARRHRPERHHQRRPHELLPERAGRPRSTRVLWLESDRMGHLLGAIDQARLDEQRGVVQNEKRQGENQPYGRVVRARSPTNTYPQGPSLLVDGDRLDGGPERRLARRREGVVPGRTTARRTRRSWSPATSKAEDAKAKVEKYFGDIPPGPPVAQARGLDREAHGHAAPDHAGPRAAGAHLQGLEHAAVRHAPTTT